MKTSKLEREDLERIVNHCNMSKFEGKVILITGATGLIGKMLVKSLLYWNKINAVSPIHIIIVVRNLEKAEKIFGKSLNSELEVIVSDVTDLDQIQHQIDYIVHCACETASMNFVNEPVETIETAVKGTSNLLKVARACKASSFVFLSSMEVYGTPQSNEKISEEHSTNIDTMRVRACYPESKRLCEALCTSYASEYNVNTKVLRLTQTFGVGVSYYDNRVFAEFSRCIIEGKDIILKTKGETCRSYLYVADAVLAILIVLLNGKSGEVYNVANENSYCSIYEMAKLAASLDPEKKIKVLVRNNVDAEKLGYAPILKMNLDTTKLKSLGWSPTVELQQMFERMISDMKSSCKN